ncbi:IS66 family insertion sequence element accessory protein TnpB [Hyalangium rubrum]|uniref:IS66 family insertion sequence element accessory protein TnpB n=1 Tax=Hyalangium rubrum TaxID=3103134 RepID=A0ABU5GU69_9BACT|nr:IS66 family insertion sequence element accessory protein TnpB [Hyalangium sp. s54d21]MDY7224735.1 IS66 family insertion sequence element accessory protein TnpB [Hyalangium sp. s54d21]
MIPHGVEIFVGLEPIDLRWGFERLAGLVETRLERPARSGALFVFFGKRRTALKVLFYDGTGLCLFYKRLDQGCFQVPQGLEQGAAHLVVEEHVLEELLDGLRVEAPRRGARPH